MIENILPNTWVIIKGSYNPHANYPIDNEFLNRNDRFYLDTDKNGVTVSFPTSEIAMEYAIRKYGLERARVAMVPMLQGDNETGYFVESV